MRHAHWVTVALAAALSTAAPAATITFDDIPAPANGVFTSATSNGFSITGAHFHIIDSDAGFVSSGSQYLTAEAAQGLGAPINFAPTAGGSFSLQSASIAELWLPGNNLNNFQQVVFTGTFAAGGTISATFTLDGIRDGAGGAADFQTVLFGAGWTGLSTVNVTGRNAAGGFGDFSIDNLVVNNGGAVPEPATWAMLIGGFGLAGTAIRRRARVAAIA